MFRHMAVALVLCAAGVAQAADGAAAKLNGILQSVSSMEAQFAQQTFDQAGGKAKQTLTGEMKVKRPGYFRWETLAPSKQLVVADGTHVWIYDPELEQATQQKLDKQVGNTPALLLSGDPKKLDESFSISEEAGAAGESVFALKPKAKDALFDTLRVSFKGRELTSMKLNDSLGHKTEIRFTQVKVNPSLSEAVFKFTPPKGVDVINQLQ